MTILETNSPTPGAVPSDSETMAERRDPVTHNDKPPATEPVQMASAPSPNGPTTTESAGTCDDLPSTVACTSTTTDPAATGSPDETSALFQIPKARGQGWDPFASLPTWTHQFVVHRTDLQVLSSAGEGVQSLVLKALSRIDGHPVAVKLLKPDGLDQTTISRWLNDVRASERVSEHPNFVSIRGANFDPCAYIITEWVAGGDLGKWLSRKMGPTTCLPVAVAVPFMIKLADAMQFAHDKKVIHRDLKPGNVLIDTSKLSSARLDQCEPKIGDLGMSLLLGNLVNITVKGSKLGTPGYWAPEQAHDPHMADARADIFSLTVMLYELLTRTLPRRNDRFAVLTGELWTSPAAVLVPDRLQQVIESCLAENPKDRIATARELAAALKEMV